MVFYYRVAKLAKDKNRARDARLKAAKEATNNRSIEPDPSLEGKNGREKKKGSLRKPEDGTDDEESRIDVDPNEDEEDPTQERIRKGMEAVMHDAAGTGTEGPGPSDPESLDGDFVSGADEDEDGGPEEASADDEEMKDPEAEEEDNGEWTGIIGRSGSAAPTRTRDRGEEEWLSLESRVVSSSNPDYLPEEVFAQAAAAITARRQDAADSKAKEGKRKRKRKRKRNREKAKAKDLLIG
jgi:hypothetical protein